MKGLTLNQPEQKRLQVLNRVLLHETAVKEAAQLMGLSERHTWRILALYRKEGAAALAHGNRGRLPTNTLAEGTRNQVVTLARTMYAGLNHTHMTELLAEREGMRLSRSSVRSILVRAGIESPRRRRPPRHRCRRERMAQEGMLLQLDGSQHDWLGGRGPQLTLLLAVDDATGRSPAALFREQEDTPGYFSLLRDILGRRGMPLAVYTDRHAVFQHASPPTEARHRGTTQFARVLQELGITQIFALSPEAKGRVERANGTFQDRLVAELRLADARTLAEANVVLGLFLPRFNERFGVPAAQPGSAYRSVDPELDMAGLLCIKSRRKVAKDNTVKYEGSELQLYPSPDRPSYAGVLVEVQERLDGQLVVCHRGTVIATRKAPPDAVALRGRGVSGLRKGPRLPVNAMSAQPLPYEEVIRQIDLARSTWHGDRVKEGMEQARHRGKHIGRPSVIERPGFPERLATILERLQREEISRRRAAKELMIGYATLKRLVDRRGKQVTDKIA